MPGVAWHSLSEKEVLSKLNTNHRGLSVVEAEARLASHGKNELKEEKQRSALMMFLAQFKDFLIFILTAAAILSWAIGETTDSIVIWFTVLVTAVMGFFQEYRAERAVAALKRLSAPKCHVIRDGVEIELPTVDLVPGDIIILNAGDRIPADSRLLEAAGMRVDESSLTGESVPVTKGTQPVAYASLITDMTNMVWMGTLLIIGRAKAVVVETGMHTEFGKIARLVQETPEERRPLFARLEQFEKNMGVAIAIICAFIIIFGIATGKPMVEMILTGVSLAVAAIPEGLPAVITVTLALGMQKMASRNAIVKKLHAVETLGSTSIICSDKTGTLTKNQMTVHELYVDGKPVVVTGVGYDPAGTFSEDPQKNKDLNLLLRIGALNNDSDIIEEEVGHHRYKIIGDTTEGALLVVAEKAHFVPTDLKKQYPRVNEFPFDPDRKRMTTIHRTPEGKIEAYVKGAPDLMLPLCTQILLNGKVRKLTPEDKKTIIQANQAMASKAYRVLMFAFKPISGNAKSCSVNDVESDLIFVGLQGMMDPPRPEAREAIHICRGAGIKVVMITGDNEMTARAVSEQIGLIKHGERALTGMDLEKMSDDELKVAVEKVSLFARTVPEHKMRIVNALIENGHICAVTGDGVNDAPALKRANIGIAMGLTGTDVAKESSEIILVDDNFATILSAVEEGRRIYDNIQKSIRFLLAQNISEVLTILVATIMNIPLPLLPIHILWINLAGDTLPAISIGLNPVNPDAMKRPPRSPKEQILNTPFVIKMVAEGIIGAAMTLFVFLVELKLTGDLARSRTIAFATMTTFQLLFAFSFELTWGLVFTFKRLFNRILANPYLFLSVVVSFLLLFIVIDVPFLQPIFYTTDLTTMDWLKVFAAAGAVIIFEEARKLILPGWK